MDAGSNGEYVLTSHDGRLCLTDPGNATSNGIQLTAATCENTANQHWTPVGASVIVWCSGARIRLPTVIVWCRGHYRTRTIHGNRISGPARCAWG
jgi:Ricin-type beta-trefoil lectin domain-like